MKKTLLISFMLQAFIATIVSAIDFAPTTEEHQKRIKETVIDNFWSEGMALDKALYTLSELSVHYDREKIGVKITTEFTKEEYNPKIYLPRIDNLTFEAYLNRLMKEADCTYSFKELEIVVSRNTE